MKLKQGVRIRVITSLVLSSEKDRHMEKLRGIRTFL
jgi:hypothetical protein